MYELSNWIKQQFDRSDNSFNLIGQYSVFFIYWLMESIQIFLKLNGLFKAEVNVPAKAINEK